MPMLKLKDIIEKMEQIEDSAEFDGWDAWIELKDWFVKQKPPKADGLANWDDAQQSFAPDSLKKLVNSLPKSPKTGKPLLAKSG